jgi:hypothetical protein
VAQPSFSIDPQRLALIVSNLDVVANDIERAESSLRSCPPAGGGVFGEYGAAAAYRDFFGQWTAEVRATAQAVIHFSRSVDTAAESYQQSDDAATQRFGTR